MLAPFRLPTRSTAGRNRGVVRSPPVANRVLPNGYIVRRNTLWKDNTFFALDFRAAKTMKLSERFHLQAIVDAFNLTNRANPKHPETTSLLFNFDGTVQSGLGDPRQAQLGLRLMF